MRSALRSAAKAAVFVAMGTGPILKRRLSRIHRSGATTVLNLHRVAPDDGSSYRALAPALFDELLNFVKREFTVVTFAEVACPSRKPKLILSFDDGYRDFVEYSVPLLKKHGLTANQNIIPRCVETGLPPLNVVAQDFVGMAPSELVNRLKVDGYDGPRDGRFGGALSHWIKMRSQMEQDRIGEQLLLQFYAWAEFRPTPMMTLEEVRSIRDQEIGAHSYQHSSMEFEMEAFLQDDLARCDAFMRNKLGIQMAIYAFPNGSCRPEQIDQALAAGVEHVRLVGEKFDYSGKVHSRFTFDGRSRSEIRAKAVGGLRALQ